MVGRARSRRGPAPGFGAVRAVAVQSAGKVVGLRVRTVVVYHDRAHAYRGVNHIPRDVVLEYVQGRYCTFGCKKITDVGSQVSSLYILKESRSIKTVVFIKS